jgi:lysyl-tRNA synthetase class 2
MKLMIEREIFELFPGAKIGWLLAQVRVAPSDEYVEKMKRGLVGRLNDIGISQDTMMLHPDVAGWRDVYSKMGVKPSKYRSSLEALLRRTFKGDIWSVSNVVDCYDCVSALSLLPMGAHDTAKLRGDVVLRYGREGEKFYPLGAGDSLSMYLRKTFFMRTKKRSAAGSGTTVTQEMLPSPKARKAPSSLLTRPSIRSGKA